MPDNTGNKPLQYYVDYLNHILNQTITDSRLTIITRGDCLIIDRYQNGEFLPLELGPAGYLHFRQHACVQSGKVIVERCRYVYSPSDELDDDEAWVFRYEYSTEPDAGVPTAHLHFNGTIQGQDVRHVHFPTGRVSLEQIVAHLILEHGVKPRTSDWLEMLAESHRVFTGKRTDLESPPFP